MQSARGSGGGGGFGGFPYRSSHQQGNDGNNNGNGNNNNKNRRGRNNKYANHKKRGGPIALQARIQIPPPYRKLLIGQKGATIKRLTEGTRCIINIPGKRQDGNPRAMVEIKASCVGYLLHGCWEVLNIVNDGSRSGLSFDDGCNRSNTYDHDITDSLEASSIISTPKNTTQIKMCSCLKMSYTLNAQGLVFRGTCRSPCSSEVKQSMRMVTSSASHDDSTYDDTGDGAFLVGMGTSPTPTPNPTGVGNYTNENNNGGNNGGNNSGEMSAYCIPICENLLNQDGISILVDNERFVDPNITAQVDVIARSEIMNQTFSRSNIFKTLGTDIDEEELQQRQCSFAAESNVYILNHDSCSRVLLIFIYGGRKEKAQELYHKILQKTRQLDNARQSISGTSITPS